jgi:hypothetical protein
MIPIANEAYSGRLISLPALIVVGILTAGLTAGASYLIAGKTRPEVE